MPPYDIRVGPPTLSRFVRVVVSGSKPVSMETVCQFPVALTIKRAALEKLIGDEAAADVIGAGNLRDAVQLFAKVETRERR